MDDLWVPPGHELASKEAEPFDALSRSVANSTQRATAGGGPVQPYVLWIAQSADEFPAWGSNVKARDAALRAFFPTEHLMLSALATTVARNMALGWKLTGDETTVDIEQRMMNNANFGGGWEQFIGQVSMDLLSQDTGAFIEWIREEDRPDAPVVMFAHLDAGRCWPTGDPRFPVVYQDVDGIWHRMPWYSVSQLLEMPAGMVPAPNGQFWRIQYSAITRALNAAQTIRDTQRYTSEKVGGRFQRAIHLVSGVTQDEIQDAVVKAQTIADVAGQQRYIQPAIVGGIDPQNALGHTEIALASLPEGWDESKMMTSYLIGLAMAFLTDVQEFAPLPGGGLGSGAQSETLNAKARGKGAGLFQKTIAREMNGKGLPDNVLFEWDEPDPEAEGLNATNKGTRATQRATRISSGEIDALAARQEALAEGDITQDIFDELNEREAAREKEEAAQAEANQRALEQADDNAASEGEDRGRTPGGGASLEGEDALGTRAVAEGVPLGNLISGRLHRAYSTAADDAHSLGYFPTTDERKKVGEAIGPALAAFEEEMRKLGVWDIQVQPDDVDRIVDASVGIGERAIDPERLQYEAESAETIEDALSRGLRVVRRRIRAERGDGDTT